MSPFPSLFDAERLFAPLYGFNLPTTQSPFAGPRPEPVLQGGTVTRSFTQTSYSAGGVQTTYSVSTVNRPNDEGGVDVYRTRKTTRQAQDGTSSTDYQVEKKQLRRRDDYEPSGREGRSAPGEAHQPRGYHYERGSDHYHRRRPRHRGQAGAEYQVEEVEDEPRSPSKHHRRHHRPPLNPDEDVGVEEIADEPVYPYGDQDIEASRFDRDDRNQSVVRYKRR